MKKRMLSLLLAVALLCTLLPQSTLFARAEGASGVCGENLTWSFDSETGTLTIEGGGTLMDNYSTNESPSPWYGFAASIEAVVFPEGLTYIGDSAFSGCTGLTEITFPAGLTGIGWYAFSDCTGLTEITFPAGLTGIGWYAFSGCTGLTEITFPAGLTEIDLWNFEDCTGLTAFHVAEDNPNYSADDCGVLFNKDKTELLLYPRGRSGAYALPASVTYVSSEAFFGCTGLTELTFSAGLTEVIDSGTFSGCTGLTAFHVAEDNPNYSADDYGVLFNKDKTELILYPCARIGAYEIPASTTLIQDCAFEGCTGLTELTFPAEFAEIEFLSFYGCTGLIAFHVAEDNPYYSVDDCGVLFNKDKTELMLYPRGRIGAYEIPASTTSIAYSAFYDCTELTELTFPEELAPIDDYYAFDNCTKLTAFHVAEGNLNYSADDCGVLFNKDKTELRLYPRARIGVYEIPASTTSIAYRAFYDCTGLTEITLPAGITQALAPTSWERYDEFAFVGCTGLSAFHVNEGNPIYSADDGVLFNKNKTALLLYPRGRIGAYEIPASTIEIGHSAFYDCTGLTEVTFPEGLTFIGVGAFLNCPNITSVCIPSSVTNIFAAAFGYLSVMTVGEGGEAIGRTVENFTIYGYTGTAAEDYATQHRFNFVSIDEPLTDASLCFKDMNLTLQSDMTMTFTVLESVLEGWSEPYVVFSKPIYNAAGDVTGQLERTVTEYTYDAETQLYAFRFTGVTAMEMSSDVTATLYATRNGVQYKGNPVSRSVQTYAMNQLGKTNDMKLKALLVDMLNYGAVAQLYFNYNTSNLANARLLEDDQQSYGTAGIPALEKHTNVSALEGATVKFKSAFLSLREKVEMGITLNLDSYTGEVDALEARISYIDTNNAPRTRVIDGADFVYSANTGRYGINFSQLNALQMRTVCTVEIFDKQSDTLVSDTLTYSIESYACSKSQNSAADPLLAELVQSMMKYGDAARAFFGLTP